MIDSRFAITLPDARYEPPDESGVNDAATCAKMGLYFSMLANGATQMRRYIVAPTGKEYWTT